MESLQFVWILLMLLVGLVAVIAAYLAYRAPSSKPDEEPVEFPRDIRQGHGRIPVVMWLLYIAIAGAMIGYTLWVWKAHPNI